MSKIEQFCRAIERGDINEVKDFLNKGIDPNIKNKDGYYPLALACWHDWIEIIKILLNHGANPNLTNGKFEQTPLQLLCTEFIHSESVKCAEILINSGASCNVQAIDGSIPLHNISHGFHYKMVKLLIKKTDLDRVDKKGRTPAFYSENVLDSRKLSNTVTPRIESTIDYISVCTKAYISRKIKAKQLLLYARTLDKDSFFYKDSMPLDIFRVLYKMIF